MNSLLSEIQRGRAYSKHQYQQQTGTENILSPLLDTESQLNNSSSHERYSTWRKREVRVATENKAHRQRLDTFEKLYKNNLYISNSFVDNKMSPSRAECLVCNPHYSYFNYSAHNYSCLYRPQSLVRKSAKQRSSWLFRDKNIQKQNLINPKSHSFVTNAYHVANLKSEADSKIQETAEQVKDYGCGRTGRSLWIFNHAFYGIGVWRHFSTHGRMFTCGWHSQAKSSHRLCDQCYVSLPKHLQDQESLATGKAGFSEISFISNAFDTRI